MFVVPTLVGHYLFQTPTEVGTTYFSHTLSRIFLCFVLPICPVYQRKGIRVFMASRLLYDSLDLFWLGIGGIEGTAISFRRARGYAILRKILHRLVFS